MDTLKFHLPPGVNFSQAARVVVVTVGEVPPQSSHRILINPVIFKLAEFSGSLNMTFFQDKLFHFLILDIDIIIHKMSCFFAAKHKTVSLLIMNNLIKFLITNVLIPIVLKLNFFTIFRLFSVKCYSLVKRQKLNN